MYEDNSEYPNLPRIILLSFKESHPWGVFLVLTAQVKRKNACWLDQVTPTLNHENGDHLLKRKTKQPFEGQCHQKEAVSVKLSRWSSYLLAFLLSFLKWVLTYQTLFFILTSPSAKNKNSQEANSANCLQWAFIFYILRFPNVANVSSQAF